MPSASSGRIKAWLLIGLMVGIGSASACAERSGPADGPHAATAPATPSAPPGMPTDATRSGETGADAFVAHYYDLVHYAQRTGDWRPLKALSASACIRCKAFWGAEPTRKIDPNRTEVRPTSTEIENNRASVSVTVTELIHDRPSEGTVPDLWLDVVQAVYQDGRWMVEEIAVRGG